jgi:hypothetical protein
MIWLHEMLELGNVAPNANYEMERMEERKRRDFYIGGGSHVMYPGVFRVEEAQAHSIVKDLDAE